MATDKKDGRSAEEKALTSHIDGKSFPKLQPEVEEDKFEPGEVELPDTLEKSHALLKTLQSEEVLSAPEARMRDVKIAKLVEHIGKLGQGYIHSDITPETRKSLSAAQTALATEVNMRELANKHPEFRGLLAKVAEMEKQILELKK